MARRNKEFLHFDGDRGEEEGVDIEARIGGRLIKFEIHGIKRTVPQKKKKQRKK